VGESWLAHMVSYLFIIIYSQAIESFSEVLVDWYRLIGLR
jgi:hypothetical protein